ncbi:MAG: glycosyltransferase family 4 protein [Bacteroidales bacterium]
MSPPKKMLWVLHEGAAGGANLALGEQLAILLSEGYRITWVSPKPGPFLEKMAQKGIPGHVHFFYLWIRAFDKPNSQRLRRTLRNLWAFLHILRLVAKSDLVCSNTLCSPLGALAARLLRKPHYWFIHEFAEEDHGFRLALPTPRAYRLMASLSEKIVVNSRAVMEKWLRYVAPEKLALLYNIVEITPLGAALPLPCDGTLRLLMLGQISRGKGHSDAIRAVALLKERGIKSCLHIVGSAWNKPYKSELVALITSLGVETQVEIRPPIDKPAELFRQYHLFLMCSVCEAFGRVTVEALKCGVPVVASDTGGSPEILETTGGGTLYRQGDHTSLADAIVKMMEPEAYRQAQSQCKLAGNFYNQDTGRAQLASVFGYNKG